MTGKPDSSHATRPWILRMLFRLIHGFTILALIVLAGAGTGLLLLWFEHKMPMNLPEPSGPYHVGRVSYAWADTGQSDMLAPEKDEIRKVVVWVWYPASEDDPGEKEDYMPVSWRKAVEKVRGPLISHFLTRDLSRVRAPVYSNAELSRERRSYPVVIMRAGLSSLTLGYSALAADLASHGYIVAGFDAPYRTRVVVFPDGRVYNRTPENDPEIFSGIEQEKVVQKLLSAWSDDVGFVIQRLGILNDSPTGRFRDRLDMNRIGIFGHSLGGAVAAQSVSSNSMIHAGIDIDGALYGNVIREGIHKPFMFLMSDHKRQAAADSAIRSNILSVYNRMPPEARHRFIIAGANHFSFSDDGALLKSHILKKMFWLAGMPEIDGRYQLEITSGYILSFFDEYLKP